MGYRHALQFRFEVTVETSKKKKNSVVLSFYDLSIFFVSRCSLEPESGYCEFVTAISCRILSPIPGQMIAIRRYACSVSGKTRDFE